VKTPIALAAALLAWAAPLAQAADWTLDPAASRLELVATFEKAPVPGAFKEFDVRVHFDTSDTANSRLEVTIAVRSADFASAEVNDAIVGPDWFDVARFPQADFHATEIRRIESNRYVARGTMSLKGIRRPIEVPFAWSDERGAARMTGELVLQRGVFGIGTGEWAATNVIGADVRVRFDVRLRQRG